MKFYKESDVQILIKALKESSRIEMNDGYIGYESTRALERFSKIEPVSVPEFDSKIVDKFCFKQIGEPASEMEINTAFEENARIRKIMGGAK